jgi:hypothetical protein
MGRASWYERDSSWEFVKLESQDKPGYYVRSRDNNVLLSQDDGTSLFDQQSDWGVNHIDLPANQTLVDYTHFVAIGQRYGFESANYAD